MGKSNFDNLVHMVGLKIFKKVKQNMMNKNI